MLTIVLRKMMKNFWMVLCLLLGCTIAVAVAASIPLYTDGILQRMLTKDLENYQKEKNEVPLNYTMNADLSALANVEDRESVLDGLDNDVNKKIIDVFNVPVLRNRLTIIMDFLKFIPSKTKDEEQKKLLKLAALKDLNHHIQVTHGAMFSKKNTDGILEVMITEQAMKKYNLLLNEEYDVCNFVGKFDNKFKVKIVGIFKVKDIKDTYWNKGIYRYTDCVFIDYDLFKEQFIKTNKLYYSKVNWDISWDYYKMKLKDISALMNIYDTQIRNFDGMHGIKINMPIISVLEKYYQREKQLKLTLLILQIPLLCIIAFFLLMVSRLIIENDRNEIAVFKSRGASRLQIFILYFIESIIICLVSLILGPLVSLMFVKFLGSANGFLEFVQRSAISVKLNSKVYYYSLFAATFCCINIVLPVIRVSKITIVQHKQNISKVKQNILLKRFFLDFVLLGISAYGYYIYKIKLQNIKTMKIENIENVIDPVLFIVSTTFILGMGLLFLRIYPLIIKVIFKLGEKVWSPVLYASLIRIGRINVQEQFIMLFLVLTLSFGVYNANTARTINNNIEQNIMYSNGVDIVLKEVWNSNISNTSNISMEMAVKQDTMFESREETVYYEPSLTIYDKMKEIQNYTKVFKKDNVSVSCLDKNITKVNFMAVEPRSFSKTAWFKKSLLLHHWYNYLNLLLMNRKAVLVSTSFKNKYKVKVGDRINIGWRGERSIEGIIFGFIDYWPTMAQSKDFVVGNLDYVYDKTILKPYEVWIKKNKYASSKAIYDKLRAEDRKISFIKDSSQDIIKEKNDPMLQGTNGAMTMGFILILVLCTVGFSIYWIISIKGRILQFGIFRAVGMTKTKILGILVSEQVFVSLVSILMGVIIGGIGSNLYIPLLEIVYKTQKQMMPFQVSFVREDYLKIYGIVIIIIVISLVYISRIISRMKISQALKLGED